MDPLFETRLRAGRATHWHAAEIELHDRTVRTCDAGFLSFGGKDFTSEDSLLGALGQVAALADGDDGQAPRITVSFLTKNLDVVAYFQDPAVQLSPVTVWWGGIDEATGACLGTPGDEFRGLLDVPKIRFGAGGVVLTLTVMSELEKALEPDTGKRLNRPWQERLWPGALGFEFVTGILDKRYWGLPEPSAPYVGGGALPPIGVSPTRPYPWARL